MKERQQPAPAAASVTATSGVLQRACACGSHVVGGGECAECREKRLQRAASGPQVAGHAPPIVHEVLRSPGQPLDGGTRTFLEPRFGYDFSGVRVHSDSRAAESARAVNALAYTVGRDVVFGAGQYAPTTSAGQRLLAHELTHVVQQASVQAAVDGRLPIGDPNHQTEREATKIARFIIGGTAAEPLHRERPILRKQDAIPVDLVPVSPTEREQLKEQGIDLPQVSAGVWAIIGGVADNANRALIEPEKKKIEELLKKANIPTGSPLALSTGARFILHDTSSLVSAQRIQEQQSKGRGPLGSGVSAYVPQQGAATITRPNFFEARRPSTTEFEKAVELFEQPADKKLTSGKKIETWKKRRDDLFRQVWNATQPAQRDQAFTRAITGLGLTPTEIQEEKTGNTKKRSDPDFNPGVEAALKEGSSERITTSASWAVEEICKQVTAATVKSIAIPGKEQELSDGCTALSSYFTERASRIASTVTVEIIQPGVKKGAKSQDTCNPKNPDIAPLSNPPYSDDQYNSIVLLYLRAALIAGKFPEITTHFAVDAFIQGHCDPRCFNLNKLYDLIAASLGHGKGSTYGVKPSYGLKSGTDTIWWDDTICHSKHP